MDTRSLLRQHDVRPRKGLGQHFLVNEDVLTSIADAARLEPDDVVVEVGPGVGSLTAILARRAGTILAVELDRDLVAKLQQILSAYKNVHIIQQDILEVHLEAELARIGVLADAGYKVVANLPYYITTPTLRYFFAQRCRPSLIVVTVQEEVANRMVATPPNMNFLAVLAQFYGQVEIIRRVPAGAFYPPPKVDSAVVRITLRPSLPLDDEGTRPFFRLVSAGFSQPRKQIHNPLAQNYGLTRGQVIAALQASGIDEKRRAETLTLDDWLRLYRNLPGAS